MPFTEHEIEQIQSIITQNPYRGDGVSFLRKLGLSQDVKASGSARIRTAEYLRQADELACERIREYFETGQQQSSNRLWPNRGLRLFVSHRDDQRGELAKVAKFLQHYGIVSFLAHDAISVGTIWRDELQLGLRTMEALLAYCSDGFADSDWTGQEVGYALGRDVPVVTVMAGAGPKGLLEQRQAIRARVNRPGFAGGSNS